jgi:4-hydroxy-L-threonine phosphate dehydrogenase PdxA
MSIRIGITCGDLNGIGPEIALKAVSKDWNPGVEFILIGPEQVLVFPNIGKSLSAAN